MIEGIVKEIFLAVRVAVYAALIGFSLTAGFYSFTGYMVWIGE